MNLAAALAETNALLRETIAAPTPQSAPKPVSAPLGRRDEPIPVQASTFLLAAAEKSRVNIFENFREVPVDRFERDGKDATISCTCGAVAELRFGQIASCECRRWYYCGTTVKWAPAPEPAPHECQPERIVTRKGSAVVTDYCGTCGEDV